jgi:hypothetical protein
MQKRAAQSGDARNDADKMARVVATAAAGIDVVELRRMLVVPASSLSASNVKRRIATLHARARCKNCPPYDATRAAHDQLPRCRGCLLLRALHRRDKCSSATRSSATSSARCIVSSVSSTRGERRSIRWAARCAAIATRSTACASSRPSPPRPTASVCCRTRIAATNNNQRPVRFWCSQVRARCVSFAVVYLFIDG